jgi:acetolactate synthase-1/3 small subunit
MTIVVNAEDERILEQVKKQLHKLIDVITVVDFTHREYIDRDLILIKVLKDKNSKEIISKLIKEYPVKIVEENKDHCFLEICSNSRQEEEILKELKKLEIKELVRTGRIAIGK